MAIVQGLWIGDSLSPMEILSIRSFLHHGHEYHLYTYGDLNNVPEGVVVKDGGEVLDSEFAHRDRFGTFTFFADRFRYRLLLKRGGWWVDTDVICVRPFDFAEEYVFGFEGADLSVNNAVMKAPAGCPLLQCLEANSFSVDDHVSWGVIGPKLLTKALDHPAFVELRPFIRPMETFFHYTFPEWEKLFVVEYDDPPAVIPPGVYGIHLGATMHKWCDTATMNKRKLSPRSILGHFEQLYG